MNPTWIDPARSRIVLVGVPSYADDALEDFEVIERNATDLQAAFTDPAIGGLDASYCIPAPPGASIADIGTLLGRAAEEAEDLLLFYYCGHGLIGGIRDRQLYLSVHDTVKGREAYTALPFEAVRQDFLGSSAARRVAILDCCFSGRPIGGTLSSEDQETAAQLQIDSSYILASAPGDHAALVLDREPHTAFTHRFLEVLREGKPGPCEALTLADIYELLQSRLIAAGLPRLQALATGGADRLPLVRNRAYAPETATRASGDGQPDAGSSVHSAYGPWLATIHESATDGLRLGCGVVIDESRILTCAHILPVVRDDEDPAIWTGFPRAGNGGSGRRVSVDHVSFPAPGTTVRDLAILHLSDPVPSGVSPAPLRSPRPTDLVSRRWWAFGFPYRDPVVSSVVGQVGATLEQGLIRLDNDSGLPVGQSFIGGGLWSPDYQAVVAVVGRAPGGEEARAITLHQASTWFLDETIRNLAERWSPTEAGEVALAAWGWSLPDDLEGRRHWRPRARGVGIDSERGYRFRGRAAALREIVGWLDREEPDRRVLVVTGAPGAGKSAVLGRIVTTADAEARSQLPAHDAGIRATVGSVACAVHAKGKTALEVAAEIARAASAAIPEQIEDFGPALREVLGEQCRRFNVIIDALDEAASPAEARAIVRQVILPTAETCADVGAQVVVGSRRADSDGDMLGTFSGMERLIDLDNAEYFAAEDLAAYTQATLQLAGNERHDNPYNDDAVARLVAARITELSNGNFLVAGLTAQSHGMQDEEPADPAELRSSPTVGDALREYLSRIPVPASAAAAASGVGAEVLLAALAFAEAPGFPVGLWRAALRALGAKDVPEAALTEFARSAAASFLIESSAGDGEGTVFRLYHQALNDALLNARARTGSRAEAEAALTRAFLAIGRDTEWEHVPAYLLRSLPVHAARAQMIDELLADDAFLLHSDLRRLAPLADDAASLEGRRRGRLLRFTPQALRAAPAERAALFSVTEVLDDLGSSYHSDQWRAPYRALWANTQPRLAHAYLRGHVGHVNAACEVSVDGMTLVATAGSDHTVRIWNPRTGEQTGILNGHQSHVNALCMMTCVDDAQLASGSDDGTVRLWNLRTGQEARTLETAGNWRAGFRQEWIKAVCEISVGSQKMLAGAGTRGIARIWNPRTGELVREIRVSELPVWSMCEIPVKHGFLLASGSGDETVRLWNPRTGDLVHAMVINFIKSHPEVKGQVHALCAMNIDDRTVLAAGGLDVELWDPENGNRINILDSGSGGDVRVLCEIEIDGHRMLAGSNSSKSVQLWDPADRHLLSPRDARQDIELMGAVRVGHRIFFACNAFDTVVLRDPREIFKRALREGK